MVSTMVFQKHDVAHALSGTMIRFNGTLAWHDYTVPPLEKQNIMAQKNVGLRKN